MLHQGKNNLRSSNALFFKEGIKKVNEVDHNKRS